jgi:DNA mismatch repair protein MutS2
MDSIDRIIAEYKRSIDRTLLRENLARTPDERLLNLMELQRFAQAKRAAGRPTDFEAIAELEQLREEIGGDRQRDQARTVPFQRTNVQKTRSDPGLNVGDPVHLPAVGTGVVREVRNRGRYLVEIKGRLMQVDGGQLQTPDGGKKHRRGETTSGAGSQEELDPGARQVRGIDLHGKTVLEAIDALDAFVNDAVLAGADELQVIHGHSSTKIRNAVHKRLQQITSIRAFALDPRNPGITIVRL